MLKFNILMLLDAENELKEAKGLINKQKAKTKVNRSANRFKAAVLSVEDVIKYS